MSDHERFMRRCLELGQLAAATGDAPVGSLLVLDGQVIAEGVETVRAHNDPTAHAEIEAIRAACRARDTLNLTGCVLYTNVEPCWMCAYAIRQVGITSVVFGAPNTDVGSVNSHVAVLSDPRVPLPLPHVQGGILLDACMELLAKNLP